MELPHSKKRQDYIDEIKVIEANIKDAADGEAPQELFDHAQKKLDKLAERFQDDKEIGSAKYKMYELQALLHYFQNNDEAALDFMHEAIKAKGGSYKRAEQLIEKIESSEKQPSKNGVIFFHKSPLTVALLSFFTFNIYSLYWSYKHWRSIRLSTGERTFPILSAIFQLFTAYPLFKQIKNNANKHGYKKFKKAGLTALGYILMFFTLNAIWRIEPSTTGSAVTAVVFIALIAAGIAAVLSVVQRAANAHNIAVLGKRHKFQKVFVGEIIFTVIGVVFGILAIIGIFSSIGTVSMDSLSSEAKDAYQKMESLRSQHDICSSDLEARRYSVNTYDDYAVNSYNSDLEDCENTRLELNRTVDEYNRLAGFEE